MRVIWRDSNTPKEYKPLKYRGYILQGSPRGWSTNIPGDKYLYRNHYCAQNAVDNFYGDMGQHGVEKRKRYGIQIIGEKKDTG